MRDIFVALTVFTSVATMPLAASAAIYKEVYQTVFTDFKSWTALNNAPFDCRSRGYTPALRDNCQFYKENRDIYQWEVMPDPYVAPVVPVCSTEVKYIEPEAADKRYGPNGLLGCEFSGLPLKLVAQCIEYRADPCKERWQVKTPEVQAPKVTVTVQTPVKPVAAKAPNKFKLVLTTKGYQIRTAKGLVVSGFSKDDLRQLVEVINREI